MSHLGERLTALVDGELGHGERDRALAHLAFCARCRTEAEALRRLKSRLRSLHEPDPGGAFVRGLISMGLPGGSADGGDEFRLTGTDRQATGMVSGAPRGGWPAGGGRLAGASYTVRAGIRPADRRLPTADGRQWPGTVAIRRDRIRNRHLLAGAALVMLGASAMSVTADAGPRPVRQVAPALERFSIERALSSEDVAITNPIMMRELRVGSRDEAVTTP